MTDIVALINKCFKDEIKTIPNVWDGLVFQRSRYAMDINTRDIVRIRSQQRATLDSWEITDYNLLKLVVCTDKMDVIIVESDRFTSFDLPLVLRLCKILNTKERTSVRGTDYSMLSSFRNYTDEQIDAMKIRSEYGRNALFTSRELDIRKTTTYKNCVDFTVNTSDLMLEIDVWDGDNFDGTRTALNCTFTMPLDVLQESQLRLITSRLYSAVRHEAHELHKERLALIKGEELDHLMDELMGGDK